MAAVIMAAVIVAAVIVALSISNVLFIKLWNSKVEEHANYVAKVDAASAQADADNARKIAEAERNTGDVARLYGDHIADLERSFVSRLRREVGHRETLSRTAEATAGVNGSTADAGSDPVSFEAQCIRLELDCAKTTLTHIHLQDWVRRVCK